MTTQKSDLRKVKVPESPMDFNPKVRNGYFHQWGNTVHISDSSDFQVTIAIVEHEDGEIQTYKPIQIKFVDKF